MPSKKKKKLKKVRKSARKKMREGFPQYEGLVKKGVAKARLNLGTLSTQLVRRNVFDGEGSLRGGSYQRWLQGGKDWARWGVAYL